MMLRLGAPWLLLGAALALGAGACASAPGASSQQLQSRAVFDLGCPQEQLLVYQLDSRSKAVVGCGRRLVYVESCQRIRDEYACTWVMNTPTLAQMQWPAWQPGQRGAPTYVFVRKELPGPGRPMATQLFEPGGTAPSAGASAPGYAVPGYTAAPAPAPTRAQPVPAGQAPLPPAGSRRGRAAPTDLYGPASPPPGDRSIPTQLFDPSDYHPQRP